jgi:hypothetical protein
MTMVDVRLLPRDACVYIACHRGLAALVERKDVGAGDSLRSTRPNSQRCTAGASIAGMAAITSLRSLGVSLAHKGFGRTYDVALRDGKARRA